MNHDGGRTCVCQADHRPAPLELERHHVWPLGMGGPDVDANVAWVCPTTHTNTHEILRLMVRDHRAWTWGEVVDLYEQTVSRYAYSLAVLGYMRWRAGSIDINGGQA